MSSLLLPPLFSPPLLSFFCPPPTERKTAETACHPGNPAWFPEQLSNISLSSSPSFCLSIYHAFPSQTASLTTERSALRRLLSPGPRNKSTHHRISPGGLKLQRWYSFAGQTVSQPCKCHGAEAVFSWHQREKTKGQVCLYVNHLYIAGLVLEPAVVCLSF